MQGQFQPRRRLAIVRLFEGPVLPRPGTRDRTRDETWTQDREGVDEVVVCSSCHNILTSVEERIAINQAHIHSCRNPHGLVFQIGCYGRAPGCQSHGHPTAEFSWFPPYRWQVAVCSGCRQHLGWHFTGDGFFYGLITRRIQVCSG